MAATPSPEKEAGHWNPAYDLKNWLRAKDERVKLEHLDFNVTTVGEHIPNESRILDIGAFDGRFGERLVESKNCRILNVDWVDANRTSLPYRTWDGTRLPVGDDERFDIVSILYVLHHAGNAEQVLREARRVLAPGGRVIVAEDMIENVGQWMATVGFHVALAVTTGMGWKGEFRTKERWTELFAQIGLEVETIRELGPHMGRRFWPRNAIYVLRPTAGS